MIWPATIGIATLAALAVIAGLLPILLWQYETCEGDEHDQA